MKKITYSIMDPTGNITALVESPVEIKDQPSVAERIMQRYPKVEQVGFVRFEREAAGISVSLRMAGGEFCGNASVSAAALYLLRRLENRVFPASSRQENAEEQEILLRVSGSSVPVRVRLQHKTDDSFRAGICMPPPLRITEKSFTFQERHGRLPVVFLEGISHIIITEDSVFHSLFADPASAESAVREWCRGLHADGLGLMFLSGSAPEYRLTPLVYVPGSGTMFWENSCASGTAAAGMYLAEKAGAARDLRLHQPGGILRVNSDPKTKETWLYCHVSRIV